MDHTTTTTTTTTPPAEAPGAACTGPAEAPGTDPCTVPAEAPGTACTGPEADPCTTPAEAPAELHGAACTGPERAPAPDPGTVPTTAPAEPFHRPAQLPPLGPGARLVFSDEQRRRARTIAAALVYLRRDAAVEPRVLLHLACFGPARIVSIAKDLGIDRTTVFRRCRLLAGGRYSRGRVIPPRRAGLLAIDHDNHGQPGSTTTLRLTAAGLDVARGLIGE